MKKLLLVILSSSCIISACSSQKKNSGSNSSAINALSSKERSEGWQLLFNGKSTDGWHSYGRPAAGPSWKIAGGLLWYDTTNERRLHDRDLVTNKEYENFDLKYEWRIMP